MKKPSNQSENMKRDREAASPGSLVHNICQET